MPKRKCPYCDTHGNRFSGAYLFYGSGRKYEKKEGKKVKCFTCKGTGYINEQTAVFPSVKAIGVND
jgi:endogenous inhibitor of DNA gyrase (YacG/DUF329 family)